MTRSVHLLKSPPTTTTIGPISLVSPCHHIILHGALLCLDQYTRRTNCHSFPDLPIGSSLSLSFSTFSVVISGSALSIRFVTNVRRTVIVNLHRLSVKLCIIFKILHSCCGSGIKVFIDPTTKAARLKTGHRSINITG